MQVYCTKKSFLLLYSFTDTNTHVHVLHQKGMHKIGSLSKVQTRHRKEAWHLLNHRHDRSKIQERKWEKSWWGHTKTKTIRSHQCLIDKNYSHRRDHIEQPWCCINGSLLITLTYRRHVELELPIHKLNSSLCSLHARKHITSFRIPKIYLYRKTNHQKKHILL